MNPAADSTVVGRARRAGETLTLETNSPRRADDLRRRVEGACAGLVRHVAREHRDVESLRKEARTRGPLPKAEATPETAAHASKLAVRAREYKARHYDGWLNLRIPALDGMTPWEAAKSPRGREMLIQLLKEMEFMETALPEAERYDVSSLRKRLGLI